MMFLAALMVWTVTVAVPLLAIYVLARRWLIGR